MNDRDTIYASIRGAIKEVRGKTPLPEYDPALTVSPSRMAATDGSWTTFKHHFTAVHGEFADTVEALLDLLARDNPTLGYCDPALREQLGPALEARFTMTYAYERSDVDKIDFGITQGDAAIAESGTLVLTDRGTSNRLAALAPWTHVVCVKRDALHDTIADAIAALPDDPNTIWVTGPSKTADVEGILIEGVHGPGRQICLVCD